MFSSTSTIKRTSFAFEVKDIGSGAALRQKREELLAAARRREIDLVIVWRLDRWAQSLVDLVNTLQELSSLKVGFISLSEALDLTTPSGRAVSWNGGGILATWPDTGTSTQIFPASQTEFKDGYRQLRFTVDPEGRATAVARMQGDKEVWHGVRKAEK
jgi:hypothetical protein